jgi:hypothetical protein
VNAVRERWRVLLPLGAATALGLGSLMYAGQNGMNCDGTRTSPVVAHPPLPYLWYAGLAVAVVGLCLAPLLRTRGARPRSQRPARWGRADASRVVRRSMA